MPTRAYVTSHALEVGSLDLVSEKVPQMHGDLLISTKVVWPGILNDTPQELLERKVMCDVLQNRVFAYVYFAGDNLHPFVYEALRAAKLGDAEVFNGSVPGSSLDSYLKLFSDFQNNSGIWA